MARRYFVTTVREITQGSCCWAIALGGCITISAFILKELALNHLALNQQNRS
jgi:hypothetical protein